MSEISSPVMQVVSIPMGLIDHHAKNARKHTDAQIEALSKSVERWGQYRPLVVRPHGDGRYECLAGNGLMDGMLAIGREHADCIVRNLDDAKANALALADNRLGDMSKFDWVEVEMTLREMEENPALEQMIDELNLRSMLDNPNEHPEHPEPKRHSDDEGGIHRMVFVLTDEQMETVKKAVRLAIDSGEVAEDTKGNQRRDALMLMAHAYIRDKEIGG